jgi:hypothetical protein
VLEKLREWGAEHKSIVTELTRFPRGRGPHHVRESTS